MGSGVIAVKLSPLLIRLSRCSLSHASLQKVSAFPLKVLECLQIVVDMAQELVYETVEQVKEGVAEIPDALTVCNECKHLVPKTMLCLWCGSPILFKMPKTTS